MPHLAFFLHDEVVIHAPSGDADRAAELVVEAAAEAGRLLFGRSPAVFPVKANIVESYADGK